MVGDSSFQGIDWRELLWAKHSGGLTLVVYSLMCRLLAALPWAATQWAFCLGAHSVTTGWVNCVPYCVAAAAVGGGVTDADEKTQGKL